MGDGPVEVRFQDIILGLSQAVKDRKGIELTTEEAIALFNGFIDMSQSIGSSAEIIEDLEAKLASKKLWRP